MNPLMKNKVDVSTMNEQERQLFQKYGKLPKKNVLTSMQKERKYFDSGDYAMHKAGVGAEMPVGSAIATPERLPHAQPPSLSSSPTNPSNMPSYAHHHHASSSASSPPTGSALSASNSFSVATPPTTTGIAIPGAGGSSGEQHAVGGLARSPSKSSGGLSPNASLAGSGLMARRPSAGVGVASIPIPGTVTAGGFDNARVSPPVAFSPLASSAVPPSSFPISTSHATGPGQSSAHVGSIGAQAATMQPMGATGAHHHSGSIGHGSSPVKPSNLKRGFADTSATVDENAVED
ncbi:hypothetical protein NCC49_005257 [Naganishia albida]|nr:hypothetical protein NCC49_005257 [Naganishia albida]